MLLRGDKIELPQNGQLKSGKAVKGDQLLTLEKGV